MKLYLAVQSIEEMDDKQGLVNNHSIIEESIKMNLMLKKKGRSHRSVIGFNWKDVTEIINSVSIGNEEEGSDVTKQKYFVDIKSEVVNLLVGKMNTM